MAQRDLFSSMKLPQKPIPNKQEINSAISGAANRVLNSKKYEPFVATAIPEYAMLRQRLALLQQNITKGMIKDSDSYKMIQTKEELQKLAEDLRTSGIFSWDLEFDSLDYMSAKMIGMSIHSPETDEDFYIPFLHCDTQRNLLDCQLSYDILVEVMKDIFENELIKKVSHQYTACDNIVLRVNTGIEVAGTYWDTLLFVNAIDENRLSGNSLKQLYTEWVLGESGKEASFKELFDGISYAFVPLSVARIYACKDCRMTWEVYLKEKQMLSAPEYAQMLKHYIDVEAAQVDVVAGMYFEGIGIDTVYAKELKNEYQTLQDTIKATMDMFFLQRFGLSGINYASPKQLGEIIYNVMKCETVDKSKKNPEGSRGTGEEFITKLVKKYPHYSVLNDLLIFRSTAKLLGTYIDGIPDRIHSVTGRVHGKWLSHGARTGRYSSVDPNSQNIPSHPNATTGKDDSRIRRIYIPGVGRVYISCDFSQIEPRILAVRANDPIMIQAYRDGKDLYSLMASQVYQVTYEECLEKNGKECKARRSSVKDLLLGLMYGRQAASIAEKLGVTKKQAEDFIDKFFATYPLIKKYIDETIRMGTLTGYVTTMAGRRRRLPDLNSNDQYKKAEAERQGVNASIQGTSADITKKAMRDIHRNKRLRELNAWLELTIHDEVVVNSPAEHAVEVGNLVRELMINSADLLIPFFPIKCDVEISPTCWNGDDGYKLEIA